MNCEASALASDRGELEFVPTESMLASKLTEEYLIGTEKEVVKMFNENPSMLNSRTGNLKVAYEKARELADLAKEDEIFMTFLTGEPQVKLEGVINGMKVIGFADIVSEHFISDLKVMANFDRAWDPVSRKRVSFVQQRRYAVQGAIYLELARQMWGKEMNFFIPAMTKQAISRRIVVSFADENMENHLQRFSDSLPRIQQLRNGEVEPTSCGECDYCLERRITPIIAPVYVGMTQQEMIDYSNYLMVEREED